MRVDREFELLKKIEGLESKIRELELELALEKCRKAFKHLRPKDFRLQDLPPSIF